MLAYLGSYSILNGKLSDIIDLAVNFSRRKVIIYFVNFQSEQGPLGFLDFFYIFTETKGHVWILVP